MTVASASSARAWLPVALVLSLLTGPAASEGFPSLGGERLSGIRVDVRPLLAQGGGLQAEALKADLLSALTRSFADKVGGRGPTLVVVVRSLSLNPYAGGQGGRGTFGGGTQSDYLDGEALVIGRRGEVIARHPQLSALPASSGGAWYDPDSERRRVAAISEHYARWLRRALPTD